MCFFYLIEQDNAVGVSAYFFSELPPFFIAYVAWSWGPKAVPGWWGGPCTKPHSTQTFLLTGW